MTDHPGRGERGGIPQEPSPEGDVAATFRIIVRGRLSARFCRGLPGGVRRHVEGDRTVIEGVAGGRPVTEVLATLGNLGVEVVDVVDVRDPAPPSSSSQEEA